MTVLPVFDLLQLKPSDFEELIGAPLLLADAAAEFTVQGVQRLKSPSPRAEPFSLHLLAPAGRTGHQEIYTVVHPRLGAMALFLVPVGHVDGRTLFESVFN